jgi:hypothetical protein
MRRTITTIIAVGAAISFSAADTAAQTIGFKLGAAFADMSTDQTGVSTSRNTGFVGGGHIRFGLGNRIGLQAELLSVTKGANFSGGNTNRDLRFEYVEIPVLVHVPLTMGGVAPYVFGGGAVGLEVKCRIAPTGGTSSQQQDCSDANIGRFDRSSPDFSLVGGAGIAIAMGPGSVIVEGRYTAGMRNINATAGGADMRHRVASVMAGYEIPLVRSW